LLAFPFYGLTGQFASAKALLMDANTKKPLVLRNDNGMPNIFVYDFGQQVGRNLWLDAVRSMVKSGVVDGIFVDKWCVSMLPRTATRAHAHMRAPYRHTDTHTRTQARARPRTRAQAHTHRTRTHTQKRASRFAYR
jgi:hypothetical protein